MEEQAGMYVLYAAQLLAPAEGLGSWEPKDPPCSFSDLWSPAKQSKQFGSRPTLGWLLYNLITVIYGQTQCSCVCHGRAQTHPVVTAHSPIMGKIAIQTGPVGKRYELPPRNGRKVSSWQSMSRHQSAPWHLFEGHHLYAQNWCQCSTAPSLVFCLIGSAHDLIEPLTNTYNEVFANPNRRHSTLSLHELAIEHLSRGFEYC